MTAPRLETDLDAITHNTRWLVNQLAQRGIGVTGVAKATLGSPHVALAMIRGGVRGLGDSRLENLERIRLTAPRTPLTLVRSPMRSQVDSVVREADCSLNTEPTVLDALSSAAVRGDTSHAVVLMVELGDLREGVASQDVVEMASTVTTRPGLHLVGLGTNLACRSGVIPDQAKMDELSSLVERVEARVGYDLRVVSGGNSANLDWALSTTNTGRINDLRLGESILLGTEPLHRRPIRGLRYDAFTLVAEVIELKTKPAQPWGKRAQSAFGDQPTTSGTGSVRQAIIALGRQDVDPDGLQPPNGMRVLSASSDHLVIDVGDHDVGVGDDVTFRMNYSALLRAMTSPFVRNCEHGTTPHDISSTSSNPEFTKRAA
ncbi:alanine/ornithine racemase family PLP-dependent enzyme [Nesterenkonia salmonea]|uniref:Alanine/ornithine racemase family PLP-dependent enzyme n=1 Tax=Nesterenkonia salmonea TaxID=1804987 RepID=A0A5R9BA33_9MICC|nr:alanine/ornithine racemase family PLP-dependent enzyme [Nesterenkonia salmonea]TLP96378.1 alanine/ornithine racemase family PLP-dependent enzyme [Nesterenkonia salmonea]